MNVMQGKWRAGEPEPQDEYFAQEAAIPSPMHVYQCYRESAKAKCEIPDSFEIWAEKNGVEIDPEPPGAA